MTVEINFNRRKEDIEEAFQLLNFIVSIESHLNITLQSPNSNLIVTQEMQCVLKAQFIIVLYNLVESTVCDCLNSIYDAILDENLCFVSLSSEMKELWKKYLQRMNLNGKDKKDIDLANMPIEFKGWAVNISGNLDCRKIDEVFKKHGCSLDESKRKQVCNSFLVIKNKRNQLAHGSISFSACGSNYLLSELKKFKEDIFSYIEDLVSITQNYVRMKKYKVIE